MDRDSEVSCAPEVWIDCPGKKASEVFLFYRDGELFHIHTDRKVFDGWIEKSPWQYPPARCEVVRYVSDSVSRKS